MKETVVTNENTTTYNNIDPEVSNRRIDDILEKCKYPDEDLLNNIYVAGCLQADDIESAEFDLAKNDCAEHARYPNKCKHSCGRNRRFFNKFKDYILSWHVANGHSYLDEEIMAMVKEVDEIRSYLDKIQNRSDELQCLLDSKEQLCMQTLKFKERMQLVGKDTTLKNLNEPNKIVYERQEDKEECFSLERLITRRSNMTPADLKEELQTANEIHE